MLAISAGDLGLPLGKGGLDRGTAERVSSGSAGRVVNFYYGMYLEECLEISNKKSKMGSNNGNW